MKRNIYLTSMINLSYGPLMAANLVITKIQIPASKQRIDPELK